MVIAIDIDEILFPLKKCFYEYLNNRFNINLNPLSSNYDLASETRLSYKTRIRMYYEFVDKGNFGFMEPIEGAVEGIKKLKQLDDLHAVTARQNFTKRASINNINFHFPKMFSGFHFGNHHNFIDPREKTKKELCSEIGARLLVEDQTKYAEQLYTHIPVILLDKPWNQDFEEDNQWVYRVKNWNKVVDIAERVLTYDTKTL